MTDFPTIRPAPTSTAERLSTFRLSTFDYETHWQSRTEPGKMAENRSKNHRKPPGFLPGVLCRGCGGCGLALPGVSVPPAACPLWAALWGVYGRFRRCCSRGCGLLAPVRRCGRLCGLFRGLPVSLYPCPVAWLCAPSVAAVGVGIWYSLHPGRLCPPVRRCPGAVALALCPSSRRGLWRDREKPGQAVQAPPGRKRTAAGIAPGAALWFYLFIFNNSNRIANGIIKSTKRTNIFNFHPLKQR